MFYQKLAIFVLELLAEHQNTLTKAFLQHTSLPPQNPILEKPECALKDIATYFCTPVHCGIFLRRLDIQTIGRKFNLPTGFGKRMEMLEKLLLCAAECEQIPKVFNELILFLRKGRDFYQRMPNTRAWEKRCTGNIKHLENFIVQTTHEFGRSTARADIKVEQPHLEKPAFSRADPMGFRDTKQS